jgi:glycosyltransferase involved in cell wall biosynthesis
MGTATTEHVLATSLSERDDVDARFARLGPLSGGARLFARHVPLLGDADLDFQALRWYVAYGLAARRVVRREVARARTDVVHVNSHSISFLLGEEMRRIPFFLSVDATAWEWRRLGVSRRPRPQSRFLFAPSSALERRAFRGAHTILAWTRWALAQVQEAEPRARALELNPGIDVARFRPAPRRPSERLRVLFVGGRFAEKGGLDLIEALRGLLGREVELDVVTPSPVPETEGVRVHALVQGEDRLVDLYQQADVFCLPTYADSMGYVLLEAMACGTAVVATNVGALPEVTGHGAAGVVVEPGDLVALRTAVEGLLGDDERRAALGAAGRERCERLYDARRQAATLVALMRDAAG